MQRGGTSKREPEAIPPDTVLICPNDRVRGYLGDAIRASGATVLRELGSYGGATAVAADISTACDALIVEIDSDVATALALVEGLSQNSPATVMVFSASTESELLMRCMRAGAREFLRAGNFTATLGEALARAAVRRAEAATYAKKAGKLLVFWGAKGGVGVTTLASNFALALRKEVAKDVALVDLNLHLGGIAVLLGFTPQFTVLDALRHGDRLDQEFVSTLMTPHETGISVLASSDEYRPSIPITNGTVGKVLHILRERYPYVVVDAGPGLGSSADELFETADRNYVITQLDIPSLRNAQRFLAHHRHANQQSVEVVLNRFESRKLEYDEERISKALGIAPRWKVPNDYVNVRRSQNTGSPLALANSPVARAITDIARAACGRTVPRDKKAKAGFLGFAW